MDTVTLTIDGREISVAKGTTVLQAAIESGINVPYYCYHPGLGVDGNCRVCLVKIEKMPKLQVSCSITASDGMVVHTGTPDVVKARAGVFEFLLLNHPLDCPVCDKGGECPLQDFSYSFGPDASRNEFPRRVFDGEGVKADVDFGPTLMLNRNRCIMCTRCIRFMREIDGDAQIGVLTRGNSSEIATFEEKGIHSILSGNLMDVCPVGAITTRDYRFKSRPWDNPSAVDTICTQCEKGCNTTAWLRAKPEWAKGAQLVRFTPRLNADVNQFWMCDIGRFAFEHVNAAGRLEGSLVRETRIDHHDHDHGRPHVHATASSLVPARNEDALCAVRDMLMSHKDHLFVVSPWLTVEEGQKLLDYVKRFGAKPIFVSPAANGEKDTLLHTGDPCPNRRGLTELGIEGVDAKTVHERMKKAKAIVFLGERVIELVGADAVRQLPQATSVAVFDCHALDLPQVQVCVGVANSAERTGTWINVDGHKGPISAVKPAPLNVRALARHLDDLVKLSPRADAMGASTR